MSEIERLALDYLPVIIFLVIVGFALQDSLANFAAGGMILIGLALILLDVKQPRMANFLPALLIAPLLVAIGLALGIEIYPL